MYLDFSMYSLKHVLIRKFYSQSRTCVHNNKVVNILQTWHFLLIIIYIVYNVYEFNTKGNKISEICDVLNEAKKN